MIFSGYGKLLGKIVEYACSVSLKTTYHGIYNGPMLPVNQLSARFSQNPLFINEFQGCLLYTSPSPRDATLSRMPSSA